MAILSLLTFTFMFPLGLSYSISGMVGHYIGQRKHTEAIRYAKVGYIYGMGLTVMVCVMVFSQQSIITKIF
jgi:Na+-driven multidrug efflux pump